MLVVAHFAPNPSQYIMKALRNFVFDILKGADWLNIRVRATTQPIGLLEGGEVVSATPHGSRRWSSRAFNDDAQYELRRDRDRSSRAFGVEGETGCYTGPAYCVGTVKEYCPSLNSHFVVFDEPPLQPRWLVCQRNCVDILVGQPGPPGTALEERVSDNDEDYNGPSNCSLCRRDAAAAAAAGAETLSCVSCRKLCHSYCLPPLTFPDAAAVAKKERASSAQLASSWRCWDCIGEDGLVSTPLLVI